MKYIHFLIFTLICTITIAQTAIGKKAVNAIRISNPPKIDGKLNEPFWEDAQKAADFVMVNPGDGLKERETHKTNVRIAYDDNAIYIAAVMYDNEPSKIAMQFGGRDEFVNTDFFLIGINPNNDGLNDTEFIVMSTGAQADARVIHSGFNSEDFSWNAVWESSVSLNNDSWVAEIKIPYSALRFSNTNIGDWGINFHRRINRLNEQYSWNYINKKIGKFTNYGGLLKGISKVKPPTRLSFSPYASAAVTDFEGSSDSEFNLGMDLKYGISESFTLDATLIPDFGQTAFDDQVLNLGPFEQHYSEKRGFFTEGTELFEKGRLFYSRRIGNTPVGFDDAEESVSSEEVIVRNPENVNMLNAIKISGRTKGGLGIGVFNAITERTTASFRNINTDEIRTMVTEPVSNYNLIVLDQQFNQNSSVSFVNSNVLRSGSFRDANVSAAILDLRDKDSKYNLDINFKMSNIRENGETTSGYSGMVRLAKTHGNVQYSAGHFRTDENFDYNDLGFMRRNNYSSYFGQISYRIFEPTKHFNNLRIGIEGTRRYRHTGEYTGSFIELDAFFVNKNRLAFGYSAESGIGTQYDFYEPRVEDRFFRQNSVFENNGWISTDFRKKFAIEGRLAYALRYKTDSRFFGFELEPRFRFNDKFSMIYNFEYNKLLNEEAYVTVMEHDTPSTLDDTIIFGVRDTKTFTNSITGRLNFNIKSSLSLSFRHYWSPVKYDSDYYELNTDGNLESHTYNETNDINYNIWNLDLSYAWEFAPGSQLVALYRNSIFNEDTLSNLNFSKNLENLFNQNVKNNVSLKFIYYLDYNKLKALL